MIKLFVLSLLIVSDGETQLVVFKSVFCCKRQPEEDQGQEITAELVVVRKMFSNGAPGVCTA